MAKANDTHGQPAHQRPAELTIVTVLEDGAHVLHQLHPDAGGAAIAIAGHLALRRQHYASAVARFVVIHGADVSTPDVPG